MTLTILTDGKRHFEIVCSLFIYFAVDTRHIELLFNDFHYAFSYILSPSGDDVQYIEQNSNQAELSSIRSIFSASIVIGLI